GSDTGVVLVQEDVHAEGRGCHRAHAPKGSPLATTALVCGKRIARECRALAKAIELRERYSGTSMDHSLRLLTERVNSMPSRRASTIIRVMLYTSASSDTSQVGDSQAGGSPSRARGLTLRAPLSPTEVPFKVRVRTNPIGAHIARGKFSCSGQGLIVRPFRQERESAG